MPCLLVNINAARQKHMRSNRSYFELITISQFRNCRWFPIPLRCGYSPRNRSSPSLPFPAILRFSWIQFQGEHDRPRFDIEIDLRMFRTKLIILRPRHDWYWVLQIGVQRSQIGPSWTVCQLQSTIRTGNGGEEEVTSIFIASSHCSQSLD